MVVRACRLLLTVRQARSKLLSHCTSITYDMLNNCLPIDLILFKALTDKTGIHRHKLKPA